LNTDKKIPADVNQIIDACPFGIVTVNSASTVDYANTAFTKITGIEIESILNTPNHIMWKTLLKYYSVDGNMKTYIGGVLTLRANNSLNVVRLSCQLPKQSNTKQILYFQDITAESEVDRMKSEFLYSATHELRNPIAIIFGFSELLINNEFDRTASLDIIETIHQQAKDLNHLTNELLDIARIESRKGKDFAISEESVGKILLTIEKEWCGRVGKERIRLTLPSQIPNVLIDKDKIKQAITNVMSNACKYSPEDSVVSIDIALDKVMSDSMIGISIHDDGFGMSTEDISHLFERFWRSDRFRHIAGTGLGMSIVKEIIEYHQGVIDIVSAVNQGTTVTIWLPVYIDLASLE